MKRIVFEAAAALVIVAGVTCHERSHAEREGFLKAQARSARERATIWQARYAEAMSAVKVEVDTVRRTFTHYDTIRSTLNVHDTVEVLKYVAASDSLRSKCEQLAKACLLFTDAADSVIKATRDERDAYTKLYYAEKHSAFLHRFGLTAGWGATVKDGVFVAGPQVGVSVRVWP